MVDSGLYLSIPQQCQHQNFATDQSLRLHYTAGEVPGAHVSQRWGQQKYNTHTAGTTSVKMPPLKHHCWVVDMALHLTERWSILVQCVNHLISPHNKASAIQSPAIGLVCNPVIWKTKLKPDENPYTFPETGILAHIWRSFARESCKKKFTLWQSSPEGLACPTSTTSCRVPACWGLLSCIIVLCSNRQ